MNVAHDQAKSIFLNAAEILSPDEREVYVQAQCRGDHNLRDEVNQLLRHRRTLGDFLETPAAAAFDRALIQEATVSEHVGSVIGSYRLLQQIGEGGMGIVFKAEQMKPLQRTVALKIIRPGMDTRQVIARFEAERQALAMMDHPNIGRVVDAGTTDSGRPYFVMELVPGVPITRYCNQHDFSVRRRVELFMQACQAVQHAHQKGIIHRDIKPSNILVAEYDGHPVPKVIDFGVAKATAHTLNERSTFTQFGQLIGTFEYMSPEQARFNHVDVDTRSDIYSLGVLLYELLTGTTPFGSERLKTLPFDETLRVIRDEEPPLPSSRISALSAKRYGEKSDSRVKEADAGRGVDIGRRFDLTSLQKDVHGDLDWIVMKCLEKDRNNRYTTADALAADLHRYTADEPVLAGRASALSRGKKFIRRNKLAVTATLVILAGLVAGVVGTSIGLISQSRQRVIAERGRLQAELNLATALQSQWKYSDAEQLYRKALEHRASATPEDRQYAARTLLQLAGVVQTASESESLYPQAIAAYRSAFPKGDPNIAHALTTWGLVLREEKRHSEVEPLFREAYEIIRASQPPDHFAIGASAAHYGNALHVIGKHEEALPVLQESVAEYKKSTPQYAGATAMARLELGRNLVALGQFQAAERELLDVYNALSKSRTYHSGALALAGLYTSWNEAEPGKGYGTKAQKYIDQVVGDFRRPISTELTKAPNNGGLRQAASDESANHEADASTGMP